MMMSPDAFYITGLKGKSKEEILKIIRGLKRETGRLKRIIETPGYTAERRPDERTQLSCTRLYLERAISAYTDAGGEYQPSKAEIRAKEFEAAIPFISRIEVASGGFAGIYETRTVRIEDGNLYFSVGHTGFPGHGNVTAKTDYYVTKEEFLDCLKDVFMGEWKRHYDSSDYGIMIMDGTQWEVTVEYCDGRRPVKFDGSNAFPFSFDRFSELMGMNPDAEC